MWPPSDPRARNPCTDSRRNDLFGSFLVLFVMVKCTFAPCDKPMKTRDTRAYAINNRINLPEVNFCIFTCCMEEDRVELTILV